MKFDISQEVLTNTLDRVSMILGTESERDSSYLFLYEDGTLYVMASSNSHLAKTPVGVDEIEAEDKESFLINGRNTKVWVENQPGGVISVTTGEGKATLVCGKSKRSTKIGSGSQYPRMDEAFALSKEMFSAPTKIFTEALSFSKVFVCQDPSTPQLSMSSTSDGALLALDDKLAGFVWHDHLQEGLDLHYSTLPKALSFLGQCTGDEIKVYKGEAKYFLRDTDSGSLLVFPTVAADFPSFNLGSRNVRQEPERWTMSKDALKKAVTALSAGASEEDDRLEFRVSGNSGASTLMLSMASSVSGEKNEQEVPDVIRQCFRRTEVLKGGSDKPEKISVTLSEDTVPEVPTTVTAVRKSRFLRALGAFKDPDVTLYFPNELLYDRLDEDGGPFTGKVKHSNYVCISEDHEGYTVVSVVYTVP